MDNNHVASKKCSAVVVVENFMPSHLLQGLVCIHYYHWY